MPWPAPAPQLVEASPRLPVSSTVPSGPGTLWPACSPAASGKITSSWVRHPMFSATRLTFPAGTVSLVAENMGWRTHELEILPLAAGEQAGQRVPGPDGTVDETGSLGEASTSCGAGAGQGIRAGTVSWITLTLAPGRYELICNLPNHYADGMHQEILATSS